MKRLLILSGLMAMMCHQPVSAQDFTVNMVVAGMPDSTKVVISDIQVPEQPKELASGYSIGGKCTLKGNVKHPTLSQLSVLPVGKDGEKRYRLASVPIMMDNYGYEVICTVPYDSIGKMSHTADGFTVKGGKAQEEYALYANAISKAERESDEAGYIKAMKWFETNADADTTKKYQAIADMKEAEFTRQRMEFVKQHPTLAISAILAGQEMLRQYKYTKDEINGFYETVAGCPDESLKDLVTRMRDFGLRFCKAMPMTDFEASDPEGNSHTFSILKEPGKYTFIDFWASWCGPCRQAISHVKELQQKYGDRLQIVNVSVDDNEAAWRKAMDKEQMGWQQLRFTDQEKMAALSNAINLSSIPRLLLINADNEIVCSTHSPDEVTEALKVHLGE